jgi:hypothetical protein
MWLIASVLAILGILVGVGAREVGRHKASILQGRLDSALQQRDEKAAALESKTRELEARQAHRRLRDDQKTRLIELLTPSTGSRVQIMAVVGDGEGIEYALEFAEVLRKAGWTQSGVAQWLGMARGVLVVVKDAQNPPPAAGRLIHALRAAGIDAAGVPNPEISDPNVIQLLIGQKPL